MAIRSSKKHPMHTPRKQKKRNRVTFKTQPHKPKKIQPHKE